MDVHAMLHSLPKLCIIFMHVRFMNKERVSKKVLNMKVKVICPGRKLRSRREQKVRKDGIWKEGRIWEEKEEEVEL